MDSDFLLEKDDFLPEELLFPTIDMVHAQELGDGSMIDSETSSLEPPSPSTRSTNQVEETTVTPPTQRFHIPEHLLSEQQNGIINKSPKSIYPGPAPKPVHSFNKDNIRKRAHYSSRDSEKKRRDRINDKMNVLRDILPKCSNSKIVTKEDILTEAIDYIRELQSKF